MAPTHLVVERGRQPCQDYPPPPFLPARDLSTRRVRGAVLCGKRLVPLLRPLNRLADEEPSTSQRLLGAPYREGGRTLHGVDCSGLVQLSLQLCGIAAPRDARDQRALGAPIPEGAPLKRGDLLFCEDHVGMMLDDRMAIQVSHQALKVTVEPFSCARPAGSSSSLERRRPS